MRQIYSSDTLETHEANPGFHADDLTRLATTVAALPEILEEIAEHLIADILAITLNATWHAARYAVTLKNSIPIEREDELAIIRRSFEFVHNILACITFTSHHFATPSLAQVIAEGDYFLSNVRLDLRTLRRLVLGLLRLEYSLRVEHGIELENVERPPSWIYATIN